jgi:hypothetical protein
VKDGAPSFALAFWSAAIPSPLWKLKVNPEQSAANNPTTKTSLQAVNRLPRESGE